MKGLILLGSQLATLTLALTSFAWPYVLFDPGQHRKRPVLINEPQSGSKWHGNNSNSSSAVQHRTISSRENGNGNGVLIVINSLFVVQKCRTKMF